MEINFNNDNLTSEVYEKPVKKRKWDRWIYFAILLLILFSLLRWIISSWIFDYADGFLKQQQFDVKFTNDISILNYNIKEGSTVKKGDTLFSYEFFSDANARKKSEQDSIKSLIDNTTFENRLASIDAEISKKNFLLNDLRKRIQFWRSEKVRKEKLVYINQITPNELANVDRSIDDVQYALQSVLADIKALNNERAKILSINKVKNSLLTEDNKISKVRNYYISPVSGVVDRFRIANGQVAYKSDIVTSLIHEGQFVRAYVDINDLDEFNEGDHVEIKLPYGFNKTLKGRVRKIYSLSELKDTSLLNKNITDNKYGVVIDIVPLDGKSWKAVKISNIPVKVKKLKFS
ncbi:HlyD family efflux transporter periplasmic adaptor subunit [Chryseobacterium sp. SSA4.19]|uniref:HlyD family efflux transporter periplasmic adaptor subunit n=1 Tax=Chryseobacterium sp. SSA4.19 TaxID=2919915 RepID=UPI001F4E7314|nr:HlyD family efflux transporter periplasmic adaptor subunit [Chryseobacterium sp. SSA4.19]MCJ8152248.1 HlyD family efflux transporter periplasmic adaptor subunit [Chryseobacterium sp. SSA4.19]